MKHVKKIITVALAGLLVLALAACGSTSESAQSSSSGSAASDVNSSGSSNSGNALVVYFSGTGNTERIAEIIADETGADLFEIEPSDPYTDDDLNYNDEDSRVVEEYEDESKQDIPLKTTTVDNWDNYDIVYFGYPIWWGGAAWPVNNFVKDNDFSGKTVIPFCTSFSSGIGSSAEDLAQMANSGDWQEGQRFSEDESEDAVIDWLDGLGLN